MNKLISLFRQFLMFNRDVLQSRHLILELAKKDFQVKYFGSFLGLLWAFIQPTITILIFWFVFEVGFKSGPVGDYPFILWLMPGIILWFFIAECIASATGAITENSFLVKKVVFRVSILPIVKILSAIFLHTFFISITILIFTLYGYTPTLHILQVPYYLLSAIVLMLGFTWMTSSLIIFLKDVGQVVSMLLQFGFWLTPIFWSAKSVPEKYVFFLKLNPVYYLIEGYRGCFLYKTWVWDSWRYTAYYWAVAISFFVLGAILFRKLRPHFADML